MGESQGHRAVLAAPGRILAVLVATAFYIGFIPLIPGTFGSVVGALIWYSIGADIPSLVAVTALVIILGFAVSGTAEETFGKKDPRYVVIDEVAGMLVAFLFIPCTPVTLAFGFIVFRLLDTVKPFPASSLEARQGSLGIMMDDLIAGLYTNLILQIALKLNS